MRFYRKSRFTKTETLVWAAGPPEFPPVDLRRRSPLAALLQVGCSKVYTSTSDVMTHENFHKKNAQLINDGFQRFRATEDCGTVGCQFYGQKTTHFHCR